jgi:hypothetical protein
MYFMSNSAKILSSILGGEMVLKNLVERQLWFIFFLFALVIVYISLHYAVGQTLVEGRKLERELKGLRAEYISCEAELTFLSKQEEVSRLLIRFGSKVHAPLEPAKRIKMEEYSHE